MDSVVIWEIWPLSPSVSNSYMVEFFIVHDMGEVKVISPFPWTW